MAMARTLKRATDVVQYRYTREFVENIICTLYVRKVLKATDLVPQHILLSDRAEILKLYMGMKVGKYA